MTEICPQCKQYELEWGGCSSCGYIKKREKMMPEMHNLILLEYIRNYEFDCVTLYDLHDTELHKSLVALRSLFKNYYGFEVADLDLYLIWRWHSTSWDASWLIVSGPQDMEFFDEFYEDHSF